MNKKKNVLRGYYIGIGLGIIILTAFLTSQIVMPLFFGRPKNVEVPNVISLDSGKAKNILYKQMLHSIVSDSTWSDDVKQGFVLSQKPNPGQRIKPDGTVYLEVSKGTRFVKVPDLTGLNVQSAWVQLRNSSLKFIVADSVYSDLYAPDTVVKTKPDKGAKVERNSVIKLFISRGFSGNIGSPEEALPSNEYSY